MRKLLQVLLICATAALSTLASAQDYPNRPVKLVLPLAAGAGSDAFARVIALSLGEVWKQSVVVENRPGAGMMLGTEFVARAPADGYTLLFTTVGHAVIPTAYPKASFVHDMTPVAVVGRSPDMLVVRSSFPANSLDEFIKYAKAQPGKINFASEGNGTLSHLLYEYLRMQTGIETALITYKGATPAITALLAGEADAVFDPPGGVLQHVKSGKFRALAVTTRERSPSMPTVPGMAELGMRDADFGVWFAILAPAGLPKDIAQKLHADIAAAMKSPAVQQRMAAAAIDPITMPLNELEPFVRGEIARFADIAKKGNIKFQP